MGLALPVSDAIRGNQDGIYANILSRLIKRARQVEVFCRTTSTNQVNLDDRHL